MSSRPITIGLRLCLDEMIDGGRMLPTARNSSRRSPPTARWTTSASTSVTTGDGSATSRRACMTRPSGRRSAGRSSSHRPARRLRRAGTSLASAEAIIADGQADLVGFARALIADPDLIDKSVSGHADEVRPCIALQECIDRRVVENLPFACGVNPRAGRDDEPFPPGAAADRARRRRRPGRHRVRCAHGRAWPPGRTVGAGGRTRRAARGRRGCCA